LEFFRFFFNFFCSNSFIFEPKVEKICMGVFSTHFVPPLAVTVGKRISYTLHGTVQLCDPRLHSFIMWTYNWPISCRKKSATCLLNSSKLFNIHKDISTSHQLLSGFLDFETHTWFHCMYIKYGYWRKWIPYWRRILVYEYIPTFFILD
jgi:hypothetical protein